jgi:hypothetical protein
MHAHTNYIAHVIYGDLFYVPTKFEENLFKYERALNHTRARTRTLAHMHAVIEHDKYIPCNLWSIVVCAHQILRESVQR